MAINIIHADTIQTIGPIYHTGVSLASSSATDSAWVKDATTGQFKLRAQSAMGFANPMTTALDIIYGGVAGLPTRLAVGTALQVLRVNAGATALEYATLAGGGNAQTADPLSQFASTTSAQLAGVMSDEVGTDKLVYNTYVAHGSSSGGKFATEFSDTPESHQSSIGCCIINETYNSEKVGYAARLDGLEPGVNGKVRQRGIVLHGSKYVEEDYIKKNGQAGRSWGCPAIPDSLHKNIIDTVKGGSLMVMYYNNPYWLDSSFYVKGDE